MVNAGVDVDLGLAAVDELDDELDDEGVVVLTLLLSHDHVVFKSDMLLLTEATTRSLARWLLLAGVCCLW